MKEPVDHILRPKLPWRDPNAPAITECGYDASQVKVITRDQHLSRLKELGYQRCMMLTCMTCRDTATRWRDWKTSPLEAVGREVDWEHHRFGRNKRDYQFHDELLAIADLIAAHPTEFSELVSKFQRQREWLEKKAEREAALKKGNPNRPDRSLL